MLWLKHYVTTVQKVTTNNLVTFLLYYFTTNLETALWVFDLEIEQDKSGGFLPYE